MLITGIWKSFYKITIATTISCCISIPLSLLIYNSKIIDNTCFINILTNISLIDLYLERLVKKNYISLSTSNKIAVKLTEINKMCNTWRKNNEQS